MYANSPIVLTEDGITTSVTPASSVYLIRTSSFISNATIISPSHINNYLADPDNNS